MNKFMKKLMKKSEGFTLVELIVVIAILAILAGIAVPAYTGYIKKANDAAVVSELSAVLTAAQAANAATGGEITAIEITSSTLTVNSGHSDEGQLEPFYTQADVDALQGKLANTSYAEGATWDPTNGWQPKQASET